MSDIYITGRHPIFEALTADAPLRKILLAHDIKGELITKVTREAEKKNISIGRVKRSELDRLVKNNKHQGIVAVLPKIAVSRLSENTDGS